MVNQELKDKILELLGQGPLSVTQLAGKLICANQKVMEAVDELDEHGLIVSSVENGSVLYALVNAADAKRPVRLDTQEIVVTRKTKIEGKEIESSNTANNTKQKILVLLREAANETLTRVQLMTSLKATSSHEIDNALQRLKSEGALHSVARGVICLGPMPIEQATKAIEKIVTQTIPEQTITDETNAEIKSVETDKAIQVKAPELREMKLGVFEGGSLLLKLTSGADLTLTPDEAQRAHKLLNLFYQGVQA